MGRPKNKKDDFPVSKKMIKSLERDIEIERDKAQLIRNRFEEMKALLAQGDELTTPPKDDLSGSKSHQLQPLPWLVPCARIGKPLTGAVGYAIECIRACAQIGGDDGDKVVINLTGDLLSGNCPSQRDFNKTVFKVQTWDGVKYPLRRMVVRVQYTPKVVRYLCINEEDFYSAMLYVNGNYGAYNADMEAYLLFEMEPGEIYYVEPEEFCVLAVTDKNEKAEEGVFTLFKRKIGVLDAVLVTDFVEGSPDLSQAEIDLSRYTPTLTATLRTRKRGRPPKAKATETEITSSAESEELVDSGEMDTTPTDSDGAEDDDAQSYLDTDSLEEVEPDQAEPNPATGGEGTEDNIA